jgi:hypothetical protein
MIEDGTVRESASGLAPDADIVSAWKDDFEQKKQSGTLLGANLILTLPSGKKVKAIRIPLLVMMQSGSVPDRLTHVINGFIQTIEKGQTDEAKVAAGFEAMFAEDAIKAAQEWTEMMNFVFVNAVISPKFVLTEEEANPDAGVFWITQVNFYDKLWLFQWAQGVDQSVHEFLQQQADALGTASDGKSVRVTPEQLLANGESGHFMVSMADRPSDVDVGNVRSGEDRRHPASAAQKEQPADPDRTEIHGAANTGPVDRPDHVVSASSGKHKRTSA